MFYSMTVWASRWSLQVLTSGRYGQYTLPKTIDAEEFELIINAMSNDYGDMVKVIESFQDEQKRLYSEKEPTDLTDGWFTASECCHTVCKPLV